MNTKNVANVMRELPSVAVRVETGAICFGDDWPGLFIRGDDCMGLASAIRCVLATFRAPQPDLIVDALIRLVDALIRLDELAELIESQVLEQAEEKLARGRTERARAKT